MSESSSSDGIGFVGLLTIVFIVLKLTEQIDWSWWWVLSPIWISLCFVVGMGIGIGIMALARLFVVTKKGEGMSDD